MLPSWWPNSFRVFEWESIVGNGVEEKKSLTKFGSTYSAYAPQDWRAASRIGFPQRHIANPRAM